MSTNNVTNVSTFGNNAATIANLIDWAPVKLPLLIQGKHEQRAYPGRSAIVHSKTGRPLDICSDAYHIHKPSAIVHSAVEAFSDVGMNVTGLQVLHGGESVVIDAEIGTGSNSAMADFKAAGNNADGTRADYSQAKQNRSDAGYSVGQAPSSRVSLKIGNTVGNPTRATVYAIEIACMNGMTTDRTVGVSVTSHRSNSDQVIINLRDMLPDIIRSHTRLKDARQSLLKVPATLETMRAYLLELSQPQLFAAVLDKTIADRGQYTPDVQRSHFIEAINSHDDVAWYLLNRVDDEGNRWTKKAMTCLSSQPMANETRGTLYQPYMAATYTVDHQAIGRGEFAADNIRDNSLFGDGQSFKAKALDLVLQYQTAATRN